MKLGNKFSGAGFISTSPFTSDLNALNQQRATKCCTWKNTAVHCSENRLLCELLSAQQSVFWDKNIYICFERGGENKIASKI